MNLRIVRHWHVPAVEAMIYEMCAKHGLKTNIAGEDEEAVFVHDVPKELVLEFIERMYDTKGLVEICVGQDT